MLGTGKLVEVVSNSVRHEYLHITGVPGCNSDQCCWYILEGVLCILHMRVTIGGSGTKQALKVRRLVQLRDVRNRTLFELHEILEGQIIQKCVSAAAGGHKFRNLTNRNPVPQAVRHVFWFPSTMSYDLRDPEQLELTRQRHEAKTIHQVRIEATSAPKPAYDFLAKLRAPKSQTPQPPALLPSSPPPPSSIPQVFIKYTPYDYTDRQKIREKLYRAALLEPVAVQIIEVGAAKRSRERAEVGPAPHGFEYVQVRESVFLTAIEGNGSMMYVGTSDSIFVVHS
ncbi:hypothetical protein DFH08DRAFT_805239 [Mycena albidolilacea]|uniref:Uncharacterized protein n=1 Tax=Mycena albidolilacea TaxID=1033008 RepID=A0AAD7A842_9AGAR|nr:hypothetical protein DFH08DRAFT_805239 [Mycena albidolilacea]